jgi:hypothetical protein
VSPQRISDDEIQAIVRQAEALMHQEDKLAARPRIERRREGEELARRIIEQLVIEHPELFGR